MKLKRILLITLALSLLVSTVAFGKAERIDTRHQVKRDLSTEDDILLSDFMVGTSAINDWTVTTAGASTVGYAKTNGPDGKEQQALLISDKVPGTANSGAQIIYNFPKTYTDGTVEVECRFKMEVPNNEETDFASNGFYIRSTDNKWATRLYVLGDKSGGSFGADGQGGGRLTPHIKAGVWYTVTLQVDMDKGVYNLIGSGSDIESGTKTIQNIGYYQAGSNQMASFVFESRMFTADWYFDYIRITRNGEFKAPKAEIKRPKPLAVPKSATPVQRAATSQPNVMRNGSYSYFSKKPIVENGEVFVPAKGALNLFGFTTKVEGNSYVGTAGENTVEIALDGTSLKVNGGAVDGIKVSKDTVYVSANKIAASLGETATWDEATKTLTINKEVAQ